MVVWLIAATALAGLVLAAGARRRRTTRADRTQRRVQRMGLAGLLHLRGPAGGTVVRARFWTGALLCDNELQALKDAMRRHNAHTGMLITAGEVCETVGDAAEAAGVEVVDGRALLQRLRRLSGQLPV
ncbi:MAG: restriction endonuclease [Pseudomonadota bacterium]